MSEDLPDFPDLEPSEPEGFHDKVVKLLQEWVNETSDGDTPILIDVGVIVYEQITLDEDGDAFRKVNYCTLTHNAGLASTMGLLSLGQDVLGQDLFSDED